MTIIMIKVTRHRLLAESSPGQMRQSHLSQSDDP